MFYESIETVFCFNNILFIPVRSSRVGLGRADVRRVFVMCLPVEMGEIGEGPSEGREGGGD